MREAAPLAGISLAAERQGGVTHMVNPSNHVDQQGVIWNQNASGAWSYRDAGGQWIPSPPPPAGWLTGPASDQRGPPEGVIVPPTPGPAKKRKAWPWIVVGAVVVLVIIIVATAGGKKSTPPAASGATATTAAPPTTAAPGTPGLNQVAKDGDFAFTVKGMQCGVTSVGNGPVTEAAPAGSQWCLVTMSVTNDKATSQDFFASNQYAIDSKGRQFSADDTAIIYLPGNDSAAFSAINPGITVSAVVPFQLSTSDSIKQLVLHDSAFSGGVTVNVG